MSFSFATCDRNIALEFLQKYYPEKNISDSINSAGPLLDFVEQDIVRIQDPMMHSNAQVIASTNWDEKFRDQVIKACEIFNE